MYKSVMFANLHLHCVPATQSFSPSPKAARKSLTTMASTDEMSKIANTAWKRAVLGPNSDDNDRDKEQRVKMAQREFPGSQQPNDANQTGSCGNLHNSQTASNAEATSNDKQLGAARALIEMLGIMCGGEDHGVTTDKNAHANLAQANHLNGNDLQLDGGLVRREWDKEMSSLRRNKRKNYPDVSSDESFGTSSQYNCSAAEIGTVAPRKKKKETYRPKNKDFRNDEPPIEAPALKPCTDTADIHKVPDEEEDSVPDMVMVSIENPAGGEKQTGVLATTTATPIVLETSTPFSETTRVPVTRINNEGSTELLRALYNRDLRRAEILIKQGRQKNQKDGDSKWTPLMYAIVHNDVNIVKQLVDEQVDLNSSSAGRKARGHPFLRACELGRCEVVGILLKSGRCHTTLRDTQSARPFTWRWRRAAIKPLQPSFLTRWNGSLR